MIRLGYPDDAKRLIKPYYTWEAEYDKIKTADSFAQSNETCMDVRILCSTDAYGVGVDNPDVEIIIQWLLPPDPESILQRMGRAMRASFIKTARYTILCQPWAVIESQDDMTTTKHILS